MITITRYAKKFAHYLRHNRAVSALEYAILVGIIGAALGAGIMQLVGTDNEKGIRGTLKDMGTALKKETEPTMNFDGQ